jgi:hypothetical protein
MDTATALVLQTWFSLTLDLLTFGTLVVLVIYTIETVRLRSAAQDQVTESAALLRESQKQTEQSFMPVLILSSGALPNVNDGRIDIVLVRNVGKGPALNATTAPCTVDNIAMEFHHRAAFAVGEQHPVKCKLGANVQAPM